MCEEKFSTHGLIWNTIFYNFLENIPLKNVLFTPTYSMLAYSNPSKIITINQVQE